MKKREVVEVYQKIMAVNFNGALFCTKAAIESITSRREIIILNESIAGLTPLVGRAPVTAPANT